MSQLIKSQESAELFTPQADDEINLLDLLLVVAKYNRMIIGLSMLGAVLGVVGSLLMTNVYTAKTVIMPPQQGGSSASMLLGSLGGWPEVQDRHWG